MSPTRIRGLRGMMRASVPLALLSLAAAPVDADTLLVAQTNLVAGSSTTVDSFNVPSAGTVTVQLANLPWPESLSSLSFVANSATQVVSDWSTTGSSSESFAVGPGTYFAHITGNAAGALDLGLYSLEITFQPSGGVVPLPASGWLLGFALLGILSVSLLPGLNDGTKGGVEAAALAAP